MKTREKSTQSYFVFFKELFSTQFNIRALQFSHVNPEKKISPPNTSDKIPLMALSQS